MSTCWNPCKYKHVNIMLGNIQHIHHKLIIVLECPKYQWKSSCHRADKVEIKNTHSRVAHFHNQLFCKIHSRLPFSYVNLDHRQIHQNGNPICMEIILKYCLKTLKGYTPIDRNSAGMSKISHKTLQTHTPEQQTRHSRRPKVLGLWCRSVSL